MTNSELVQWETPLSSFKIAEFLSVEIRHSIEIRIRLYSANPPYRVFVIKFESNPYFRCWEEQYQMMWCNHFASREAYSSGAMSNGLTLKVRNSKLVELALLDGWFTAQHQEAVKHYVVVTTTRVLECLSSRSPIIQEDPPLNVDELPESRKLFI